MENDDPDQSRDESDSERETHRVERTFTCTLCGYGTTHPAGRLQAEVQATCLNCGDWTVQTADTGEMIDAVRDAAERFAGPILTERQSLAYLLRELLGVDRQVAAEEMGTTPSNVDNLQRRAREKVADARRIVEELRTLQAASQRE